MFLYYNPQLEETAKKSRNNVRFKFPLKKGQ